MKTIGLSVFRKFSIKISQLILLSFLLNMSASAMSPVATIEKKETPVASQSVYKKLAMTHLPSLAKRKAAEQEAIAQVKAQNKEIFEKSKERKQMKEMYEVELTDSGKVEELELLYNLFSVTDKVKFDESTNVLANNTIKDLEMLCGNLQDNPEHNVFSVIDHTKTSFGKIELQKMLIQPTANVQEVKRRQNIIKAFIENDKLYTQVGELLGEIDEKTSSMLWYMKTLEEDVLNYFEQAYMKNPFWIPMYKLNKNAPMLEFTRLGKTTLIPAYTVLQLPLMVYFYYLTAANSIAGNLKKAGWALGGYIACLIISSMFSPGILTGIKNGIKYNKLSNNIHEKVNHVATLTTSLQEIGSLLEGTELAPQLQSEISSLKNIIDDGASAQARQVINDLSKPTFKGQPSYFSYKGRALATFKRMFDVVGEFARGMKAVGELDALRSVAELYRLNKKNTNGRFCFVDFIENAEKPSLNIEGFWHIYLNPKTVVLNNADLGGTNGRNLIITGPNAGGKSTSLQAITGAITLAQAFGLAPATKMTMTPFSKIVTYLNMADHIGKESLFQAEMRRVGEFLTLMKSLKPNEFCFVIMDEMFTGTNPKEGEAGSYGVAKNIAKFDNVMCLLATHFPKMTELEQATNGTFRNFKVEVIMPKDKTQKLIYTYKLTPGKTDQAIALFLLSQENSFDQSIIDDAMGVLTNA